MTRRSRVAAVFVAVIALGVLAAFLLLRNEGDDDAALSTMSNRGRPIEMEFGVRISGDEAKPTGEVVLLAERGGLRFLRLPRTDGKSCWAIGERRSNVWQLTGFSCERGLTRFPDPKQPVMTVGRLLIQQVDGLMDYTAFAGFAADGVKRVAIVDAGGRVIPVTSVVDNTFFSPVPPQDVKAVAALDAKDDVIWRGSTFPPPDE